MYGKYSSSYVSSYTFKLWIDKLCEIEEFNSLYKNDSFWKRFRLPVFEFLQTNLF